MGQKVSEEDIGYIKRAIEDMAELINTSVKESRQDRQKLNDRLKKIEAELSVYKTVYRGVKWIFAIVLLILTLRFGDIPKLFGH